MNLTQPKIDYYLHWLGGNEFFGEYLPSYDDASRKLLDELFHLLEQLEPIDKNGCRSLWFWADRGPIEDFGDVKEAVEDGSYPSEEAFVEAWKDYYPDDVEWYYFKALEDKPRGYRAVLLGQHVIIVEDAGRKKHAWPYEITEFVQWIVDSVRERISMLQAGTYNNYVAKNLPPQHRTGTIERSALWFVWPDARKKMFEGISEQDIKEFCQLVSVQPDSPDDFPHDYPNITANDFFRFCAIGYKATGYDGCDRSPKDQYLRNADGRDEDLTKIDPDSHTAFVEWLNHRTRIGHPWEVMRGGNSTHVSLYVYQINERFVLTLDGNNRTNEVIKFYLALNRAGYPVFLNDGHAFFERVTGTERIGIVPHGITPMYCENYFREPIIAFMNLPFENRDKFAPLCVWQDIPPIHLKGHSDSPLAPLTEEEQQDLKRAKDMPVDDSECPETTPEQAAKFKRVHPTKHTDP